MIEVVVALLVLSVGALGFAACAAAAARASWLSSQRTLSASASQTRLEELRAAGCPSEGSGSAVVRSVPTRWQVSSSGAHRVIAHQATRVTSTGQVDDSLRLFLHCR